MLCPTCYVPLTSDHACPTCGASHAPAASTLPAPAVEPATSSTPEGVAVVALEVAAKPSGGALEGSESGELPPATLPSNRAPVAPLEASTSLGTLGDLGRPGSAELPDPPEPVRTWLLSAPVELLSWLSSLSAALQAAAKGNGDAR